jgi:hypothetical protein
LSPIPGAGGKQEETRELEIRVTSEAEFLRIQFMA